MTYTLSIGGHRLPGRFEAPEAALRAALLHGSAEPLSSYEVTTWLDDLYSRQPVFTPFRRESAEALAEALRQRAPAPAERPPEGPSALPRSASPHCPRCGSLRVFKIGFDQRRGVQRRRCRACGRAFLDAYILGPR